MSNESIENIKAIVHNMIIAHETLIQTVWFGSLDDLTKLTKNYNFTNHSIDRALDIAVDRVNLYNDANLDVAEFLIQECHRRHINMQNAFHDACRTGCLQLVKYFVETNAQRSDWLSKSVASDGLLIAANCNRSEIVKYLLQIGFEFNGNVKYCGHRKIIDTINDHCIKNNKPILTLKSTAPTVDSASWTKFWTRQ